MAGLPVSSGSGAGRPYASETRRRSAAKGSADRGAGPCSLQPAELDASSRQPSSTCVRNQRGPEAIPSRSVPTLPVTIERCASSSASAHRFTASSAPRVISG